MTLVEFYERLERHDWYYDFSDDGGVWRAGSAERTRLMEASTLSPEHAKLFKAWKAHAQHEDVITKRPAKPERPSENA